jgi:hypothetical protein
MYITNMTHLIDETGNIPSQGPKEARELASFMALVVDESTKEYDSSVAFTSLRCFRKKCVGTINSEFLIENDEIHWACTKCKNEGIISYWQSTRWDNR